MERGGPKRQRLQQGRGPWSNGIKRRRAEAARRVRRRSCAGVEHLGEAADPSGGGCSGSEERSAAAPNDGARRRLAEGGAEAATASSS